MRRPGPSLDLRRFLGRRRSPARRLLATPSWRRLLRGAFWFSTLAASELLLVAQYFWLATVRLGCCEGGGSGKARARERRRERQRRQRRRRRRAASPSWAARLGLHSNGGQGDALPSCSTSRSWPRARAPASEEAEEEKEGERGPSAFAGRRGRRRRRRRRGRESPAAPVARPHRQRRSVDYDAPALPAPLSALSSAPSRFFRATSRRFSLPVEEGARVLQEGDLCRGEAPALGPSGAGSLSIAGVVVERRRREARVFFVSSSAAAAAAASPAEVEALREYLCTREGAQDLQERVNSALLSVAEEEEEEEEEGLRSPRRCRCVRSPSSHLSLLLSRFFFLFFFYDDIANAGVITALFEVIPRSLDDDDEEEDDDEEGEEEERVKVSPRRPPSLTPAAEVAAALLFPLRLSTSKWTVILDSLSSSPPAFAAGDPSLVARRGARALPRAHGLLRADLRGRRRRPGLRSAFLQRRRRRQRRRGRRRGGGISSSPSSAATAARPRRRRRRRQRPPRAPARSPRPTWHALRRSFFRRSPTESPTLWAPPR